MSNLFIVTNEEKSHLKRLNDNKPAILALKKLFLNIAVKNTSSEVQVLAAQRIAIDIIQDSFHQLSVITPENQREIKESNLV